MKAIQPEDVYGPGTKYKTLFVELECGLPPHCQDDADMNHLVVGEGPWATVGEAHSVARRESNRLRRVNYGRLLFAQRIGL